MKVRHVAGLCVVGTLLSSFTVYSLTPPGGLRSRDAGRDGEVATPDLSEPKRGDASGRFEAGTTLKLEGRVGHETLAASRGGALPVLFQVRAAEPARGSLAAPVSVALLIDRSGSMKGERIQNARDAATGMVERLRDGDTVAVITYDTRTRVVVPPTTLDDDARRRTQREVRSIELGGDTCISCGLEAAIDELSRTDPGAIRRIVLLSDGEANHGVRDVLGFRSIAERARRLGIGITTVGVDVDYNERILAAVAAESNGRHHFVENAASLPRIFDEELQDLVATVAGDAVLELELAEGVRLERILDRPFSRDGARVSVPLGTFGERDRKTVLAKLDVPTELVGTVPVIEARLTYRDLVRGADGSCDGRLAVRVASDVERSSPLDPLVELRLLRNETASALKEANSLFSLGKADEARRRLSAQSQVLRGAAARARALPEGEASVVDSDVSAQASSVARAESQFASPPAAAAPGRGVVAAEPSRDAKAAVRKAEEDAFTFSF